MTKKYLLFIGGVIAVLFALFLVGGPVLSPALKSALITELENLSGERVVIGSLGVTFFPVSVVAKDVRMTDVTGEEIVAAGLVKGYIGLGTLPAKTITIRRLVLQGVRLTAERQKIEAIVTHITSYLEQERPNAFTVKIKSVEVDSGEMHLSDHEMKGVVDVKGFSGELIAGGMHRVRSSAREVVIQREGWPTVVCDMDAAFMLKSDGIDITSLKIGIFGSQVAGKGVFSKGKGAFNVGISLIVDSVKRLFGLREKGDGNITVQGEIRLGFDDREKTSLRADEYRLSSDSPIENGSRRILDSLFVNLKLKGNFYIEMLMELLRVKEEVKGLVDFEGAITGPLSDVTGKARAELRKGNLFGVDIDALVCKVSYKNKVFAFEDGYGTLYRGKAHASAVLSLPASEGFSVDAEFQGIDSMGAFKFIHWDPGLPDGKVDGTLTTSGSAFQPDGWFTYRASANQGGGEKAGRQSAGDVLSRIASLRGNYSMRGRIVALSDLSVDTRQTHALANGTIDIEQKTLDMTVSLKTDTVSDLTSPYYRGIDGRGSFSGWIRGPFENPTISGAVILAQPAIEGYRAEHFSADFSYRKRALFVEGALLKAGDEEHRMRGTIAFPDAEDLFDFSRPEYDLTGTVRNADFGRGLRRLLGDIRVNGILNADLAMRGTGKDFVLSGRASLERGSVYAIPFDVFRADIVFERGELTMKGGRFMKGKSAITAEGRIGRGGVFSYRASAEQLFLTDFGLERMPRDAAVAFQSEGQGTFDDPLVSLNARVLGGTFKGRDMGSGTINAELDNRVFTVRGSLFDEKVKLLGSGYLDDRLNWKAELSIQPARYDFLMSALLRDVPEDLQLILEGRIGLYGDKTNVHASARLNRLMLSLFGQSFANDSDILFSIHNRKLVLTPFSLKSGEMSFSVRGGIEVGKEYDIELDGRSSLAPLKGMSKKIGYLRGDADFVFLVRGDWDKPDIKGGMTISDASFGVKGYATYLSSINGYLYVDENRIIIDRLEGKIGGGGVRVTGFADLDKFRMKRFHLEASLDAITAKISQNFPVTLGGNLLYRGSPDAMSLTGTIRVTRARYRETVEWRSWLLAAKKVEIPKTELTAFDRTELNIQIKGSENISVDNNIARAPIRIRGDALVKGTLSNPILFGRLESNDGYIYFRNNEFRIVHASADFADPHRIKPILNLSAETLIKGYRIRMHLEGETDRFVLSLSSDPPLEEVDILSLLTVGQLGKQTKGLEGGIGASTATAFITGRQQDIIEERIRALTGIDRFQVEPYVSKTTGTIEPRVTVSERLIGDKVYVTYTTSIGSVEEQILKVEYLLNRNVSLIGTRDENASIGGDIKFRFEFR